MTNLLLLLSAMLSALIGAGPVARVAQAPVAVAGSAERQVTPAAARRVAARPLAVLPDIAALIGLGITVVLCVLATVPAWKLRRRE